MELQTLNTRPEIQLNDEYAQKALIVALLYVYKVAVRSNLLGIILDSNPGLVLTRNSAGSILESAFHWPKQDVAVEPQYNSTVQLISARQQDLDIYSGTSALDTIKRIQGRPMESHKVFDTTVPGGQYSIYYDPGIYESWEEANLQYLQDKASGGPQIKSVYASTETVETSFQKLISDAKKTSQQIMLILLLNHGLASSKGIKIQKVIEQARFLFQDIYDCDEDNVETVIRRYVTDGNHLVKFRPHKVNLLETRSDKIRNHYLKIV